MKLALEIILNVEGGRPEPCGIIQERLFGVDILPQNAEGYPATKEFLMKVVDILLDYIKVQSDRDAKILDFHHPSDMMRLLDLEIPDSGVTLQQLLVDCSTTLKYQVKTGEFQNICFLYHKRTR